jgi:hypothetical protein
MRMMIARMLEDGIPRTRAELDELVQQCSLSQAKEFRAWLDRVWEKIEAESSVANDPELILLRERNAALGKEIAEIKSEKRRLEARIRELESMTMNDRVRASD